jgi:hypothetical protein
LQPSLDHAIDHFQLDHLLSSLLCGLTLLFAAQIRWLAMHLLCVPTGVLLAALLELIVVGAYNLTVGNIRATWTLLAISMGVPGYLRRLRKWSFSISLTSSECNFHPNYSSTS